MFTGTHGLIIRILSLLFVLTPLPSAAAAADSLPGTLRGKVSDPAQAPIAGARVIVGPDGAASGPTATPEETGLFALPLGPALHPVTNADEGFEAISRTVTLGKNGGEFISVVMQVAGQHDAVTIVGTDYHVQRSEEQ